MKKERHFYYNAVGADTFIVSNRAGTLHRIILGRITVGSTIFVLDTSGGSGTGRQIHALQFTANDQTGELEYGVDFETGLVIITTGDFNLCIVFSEKNPVEESD